MKSKKEFINLPHKILPLFMAIQYLSPTLCKDFILNNSKVQCIDIREPYEYELGNNGFINIPMSEAVNMSNTLDVSLPTIILCKSGKRAEVVANFLLTTSGFTSIIIVQGGITAWKECIDPSIQLD